MDELVILAILQYVATKVAAVFAWYGSVACIVLASMAFGPTGIYEERSVKHGCLFVGMSPIAVIVAGLSGYIVGALICIVIIGIVFIAIDVAWLCVSAWNSLAPRCKSLWQYVESKVYGTWNSLTSRCKSLWQYVESKVYGTWNSLTSRCKSLWQYVESKGYDRPMTPV